MRRDNSEFKTGFVCEDGTMRTNKDFFAFVELDDMACWVAADGIDSDEDAKSAEIAANSIFSDFMERPTMSRGKIKKYLMNAHKALQVQSRSVRLKCSLVMVVTDYSKIVWAVAGNSRVYHFRKGRLSFRSKDQSVARMMAEVGKINEDEADRHEERNNLVSYLGTPNSFKPFISKARPLCNGDVLLLCTLGLWESVNSGEMTFALKDAKEPNDFVDALESILIGKQNKVVNNYTIAAVFANKVFVETKKSKGLVKKIAMALVPLLIIGGVFVAYRIMENNKRAELKTEMVQHEKDGDGYIKDGSFDKASKEYGEALDCARKVKDKGKKDELDRKQKITQLVMDGDASFKEKDFQKAKDNYQKAKTGADAEPDYDKKELDAKMEKTQTCLDVLAIVKEADKELEGQNFLKAKTDYEKARDLAEKVAFNDMVKELKSKMDEADGKISELDKQKRYNEGKKFEINGDKQYSAQQFVSAIRYYKMAQDVYQELNMAQDVLGIEKKIENAQAKMAPIEPPPAPKAQ